MRNPRKISVLLLSGVLFFTIACSVKKNQTLVETKAALSKEERMKWWEEARFGMFIHWGIYSVPAGFYKGEAQTNSAEWIMNKGKIPIAEYEKFADEFNPTKFDANEFVALAKEAGMKYMVITAKHHDGFSMFDSKATDYNVVDATPFKRDVLKELAKACKEQDIKFGFYYSQAQDWHHPGGMGNTWDDSLKRMSSDDYVYEKALPEVEQLLTEYGPISIFWWDTPRKMTKEVVDSLYHITSALQPGIITNDRLGEDYPGDHKTFERKLPSEKPEDTYWEICQPISGSWGYRSDDDNFKSVETLIHNLIDASSKGGNYLLNVSPTHEGTLRTEATTRLKTVGAWMKKNNESIYKTQASPCEEASDWGKITMKQDGDDTTLYLHVYHWNDGAKLPVKLKNEVVSSYLLTDATRVFKTNTSEDGISVIISGEAPDSIASVVVLKIKGTPNAIPRKPIGQDKKGNIDLVAKRAQFQNLQGPGAEYNQSKDHIDHWTSDQARVYWKFTVEKPGTFTVEIEVANQKASELSVSLHGETKHIKIPASGSYNSFQPLQLGTFHIDKPGAYELSLMPVSEGWNPMNIKSINLISK
ncbi:alpha-L-fucosidase [Mariniflexile sp. AS56]|uniref:alpha-L-fucosidase n=1 Tax=Mariniflexile sp. AS56 TaxID=3063957 RepID=UPI0026F35A3B|nr:alpha-L-fucosidase [Mariniflexile sp. AS56]MDO7171618.1 alpha-L-fucosidase [Mariniflexile sp. AS56]